MFYLNSLAPKRNPDSAATSRHPLPDLANLFLTSLVLAFTLTATVATAQDELVAVNKVVTNCRGGFNDTWIVTRSCEIGDSLPVKVGDAIHISCDANTSRWTVQFFIEPEDVKNDGASQAVPHTVCPANGMVERTADGDLRLTCNFWEPAGNSAERLEFDVLPGELEDGSQIMNWRAREIHNPDVVCGTDTSSKLQSVYGVQMDGGKRSGKRGSLGIQVEDTSDTAGSSRN